MSSQPESEQPNLEPPKHLLNPTSPEGHAALKIKATNGNTAAEAQLNAFREANNLIKSITTFPRFKK